MKNLKLLLIALLSITGTINSQVEIVSYSSAQNAECSGIIANDANVTANGICRGPGIVPNTGGTYNSRSWTMDATIGEDDYLEWTVTPNVGYALNLTTMDIRYDRSDTGPTMVEIQVDSGSGFSTIYTDMTVSASSENNVIDLSAFTNVTGTLKFKLFAFNASATGGTFDIEQRFATNKGIVINGNIEPICISTTTWTATGLSLIHI